LETQEGDVDIMNSVVPFVVDTLFSFMELLGFTVLAFSLFRIPIVTNRNKIAFFLLVTLTVLLIQQHWLESQNYFVIVNLIVAILLIRYLFSFPVVYAVLIWISGIVLAALIQMLLILAVSLTGFATLEETQNSQMLSNFMIGLTTAAVLLVSYVMQRRRLGFMFITRKFQIKSNKVTLRDWFAGGLFVSSVTLIQSAILAFKNTHYLMVVYFTIAMMALSIIGLYLTYRFNIREIEERIEQHQSQSHD